MDKMNFQMFGTGVFPVHNNIFKIGISGRASTALEMVTVKDLETFSPAIDGNVEEWTPMDQSGWTRRAVTGKGLTISFSGKRNYGDPGNNYIGNLILSVGQGVETKFEWVLPNGDVLSMDCIINVTTTAGGDSTNIDTLEFEVMSDGLPEYTANASLAALVFECEDGALAGTTKITSVVPTLTVGNSYLYKVNAGLPTLNASLVDSGWAAYTLGEDIPVINGNIITLVEATAASLAKKGGQSVSVVE